MALGSLSSAIHIQQPSTNTGAPGRTPAKVTVHPVVLFSILDHYLRRPNAEDRVIGTLLGTRTENELEIRDCFAVLHSETSEQVAVDMDYHRAMFDLHKKANPKESIVGWYSTGSDLNTYSALIHNFYSQETSPHQAIHLAIDTGTQEGVESGVKAYVSAPVGVNPKPENALFLPVPTDLQFNEGERSSLSLLSSPPDTSGRTAGPTTELDVLEKSIRDISNMIDRVLTYVRGVLSGEKEGNERIGRYLMDTLCETTESLDKGRLETLFNAHLQDTLMVSYLANLIRSQVEVSSRLTLLT